MNKNQGFCAYYRVSTDKQGHSGLGLEAQRVAVEQYQRSCGGEIIAAFTEIESGKKNDRPELQKAIELCRKTKTVLLIAKLDRLSRNLHFISGLMESGIEFKAADNPHASKLMVHMLAAFAEHEREMISERTKNALQAAKERGAVLGRNGKVLARHNRKKANDHAKDLAPLLGELKDQGFKTVRAICVQLNQRGALTLYNNPFQIATTHSLLKRVENLQGH